MTGLVPLTDLTPAPQAHRGGPALGANWDAVAHRLATAERERLGAPIRMDVPYDETRTVACRIETVQADLTRILAELAAEVARLVGHTDVL